MIAIGCLVDIANEPKTMQTLKYIGVIVLFGNERHGTRIKYQIVVLRKKPSFLLQNLTGKIHQQQKHFNPGDSGVININ